MWNALASGASGVVFWQWRPELLGPESPGYGLCTPDGTPTGRVRAVTELAAIASRPEVEGLRVEDAESAILLSRRSALHAFASDHHMDLYRDAVMGSYRLFVDADIPVDLLHEDRIEQRGVPAQVRTLYWPMPATTSDRLAAALSKFVERGGRLIAEAAPGEYDEHGRRYPTVPGAGMDTLFGLVEHETTVSPDQTIIFADGGRLGARWQTESLRLGAAVEVGAFADGAVAATTHVAGAGTAELLASYPSLAYARDRDGESLRSFATLIAPAERGWVAWRQPAPGLMTRRGHTAQGARLAFALNWTNQDSTVDIADAAEVITADRPAAQVGAGDSFVVPAMSGALVVVHLPGATPRSRRAG